ncbi:MAG TPA: hypothetical protein VHM31_06615 [Polyangia bacterium]|nr:hypothetical protein [Polyangia bacterium]
MKIALLLQVMLWAAAGDGPPSCPTRDAVAQAVAQALPSALREGAPAGGALPASVQVTDLGDAFEVAVGRQVQRYADPARDCAERARVAAVFVALALSPPAALAPPPPPPPVVPPPPPAPPEPRAADLVRLGLAARFDTAAGGGQNATGGSAIGGEARVSVGRHALAVQATAGVMAATETPIQDVRVREQRFPCSLAAAFRHTAGAHVALGAAAGVSLTPFTLRGQGLMSPSPGTRLDVGGRLELAARWVGHALAPFVAAHVEYFPRAYDIDVTPLGAIGKTAPVQVGLSAGVDLSLR